MVFHTWSFAIFFLIAYPAYLALKNTRLGLLWLLVISYGFYAAFDPWYVVLIVYATVFDYGVLWQMSRRKRKQPWLILSLTNNLGLLSFFKYGVFLANNINALLAAVHCPLRVIEPTTLWPVGLSFYLFQSMGYIIDCYRGTVPREPNLLRHAVFVAFFPRLLAGPIERAGHFLPQLQPLPKVSQTNVGDGLSLLVKGLFKKLALADYLALYVNQVYSAPTQYQSPALILATFLFGWQIYFDFSAYTDMARGIARMMGFDLVENFHRPYLATGLKDFWRRWHISLSSWFRDYVYIPLGGNRAGRFRFYRNAAVALLLSGLWHGAAWTFVVWGGIHALGYSFTRRLEDGAFYQRRIPTYLKALWVFVFVTFGWIFFRAETLGDAWCVLQRIFTSGWADPRCPWLALVWIGAVWVYEWSREVGRHRLWEGRAVRVGLFVMMILYLAVCSPSTEQPFIYMQF